MGGGHPPERGSRMAAAGGTARGLDEDSLRRAEFARTWLGRVLSAAGSQWPGDSVLRLRIQAGQILLVRTSTGHGFLPGSEPPNRCKAEDVVKWFDDKIGKLGHPEQFGEIILHLRSRNNDLFIIRAADELDFK